MKTWQKDFIWNSLPKLQDVTTAHVGLLARFNIVLTREDNEELNCEGDRNGAISKASLFYKKICNRELASIHSDEDDLYAMLINVLEETKQFEAVRILKEGYKTKPVETVQEVNGPEIGPSNEVVQADQAFTSTPMTAAPAYHMTFNEGCNAITLLSHVEEKFCEYVANTPGAGELVNVLILKAQTLQPNQTMFSLVNSSKDPITKIKEMFEAVRSTQNLELGVRLEKFNFNIAVKRYRKLLPRELREPIADKVIIDFLLMLVNFENRTLANFLEAVMVRRGANIKRR